MRNITSPQNWERIQELSDLGVNCSLYVHFLHLVADAEKAANQSTGEHEKLAVHFLAALATVANVIEGLRAAYGMEPLPRYKDLEPK